MDATTALVDALRKWTEIQGYYHDAYNCDLPDNCGHCAALEATCDALTLAGRSDLCVRNGYDLRLRAPA